MSARNNPDKNQFLSKNYKAVDKIPQINHKRESSKQAI
jgi:hypothetical protein